MPKLVVCTNPELLPSIETADFKPNAVYRHIEIDEKGERQHLVYGVVFDDETFRKCFTSYDAIIQERARKLFYRNGKPMTKKEFKTLIDIHQYGKRGSGVKVAYFGQPKENCFGVRVNGYTNVEAISYAYDVMTDFCNGDIFPIVGNWAKWFDSGIPISMSSWFWVTSSK